MAIAVYMDQWVWIKLAQVHYGKSEEWRDAYDAVVEAKKSGTAFFPLSLSHLQETAGRTDDASRGRLVEFMAGVWDADAIRPWSQMVDPEVRNFARRAIGLPWVDLTSVVFGKGISHVLGASLGFEPTRPDPDPEQLRRLLAAGYSPERWLDLKDPTRAREIRALSPVDAAFAAVLQKAISAEYSHPDKRKRQDIAKVQFIGGVILDPLLAALKKFSVDPEAFQRQHMASRDQLEAMVRDMPTLNTFHTLNYARNTSRPVKVNDLWDFALSIAIPYCDIVVTEKQWCSIARQKGLDGLYETQMVHTSGGLANALRAGG